MAIAKKDRFVKKDVNEVILDSYNVFPPVMLSHKRLNLKLFCLGSSNKDDLIPSDSDDYNRSENKGQFIYCSDIGDMYEICLYTDYVGQVMLHSIRTRLK